jgi:hypothetical protein
VTTDADVGGRRQAFELRLRNILTGEQRDVTIYATDPMAAVAVAFKRLEVENRDRCWRIDRLNVPD